MARIKIKEFKEMNEENRKKKLRELKIELIKSRTSSSKTGSSKTKEIKKTIARILTISNSENKGGKK